MSNRVAAAWHSNVVIYFTMATPKLCKNCRHFSNDHTIPFTSRYGKCRRSIEHIPARTDMIDGRSVPATTKLAYASIFREHGGCSEEGLLFEREEDPAKRFWNEHGGSIGYGASAGVVLFIYLTAMCVWLIRLNI